MASYTPVTADDGWQVPEGNGEVHRRPRGTGKTAAAISAAKRFSQGARDTWNKPVF